MRKVFSFQNGMMMSNLKGEIFIIEICLNFDTNTSRGQKYFKENRLGIMFSINFGFFSVAADPKIAEIFEKTSVTSTAEIARKRYLRTFLGILTWYEDDLKIGSR